MSKISLLKNILLGGVVALPLAAGTAQAEDYNLVNVGSLTGTYAFVGVPLDNGLKLAAEQINASGMLGEGNKIVLRTDDGASERGQAIQLVTRHGNDKNVLLVFGPTSTIDLLAAGPVAKETGLPQMTNSPAPQLINITDRIFRASVVTTAYMQQIADYAIDKMGVKACAFVTVNDNEGYLLQRNIVRDRLIEKGGKMVADETMKSGETDYTAMSTKIVAAKPDCVAINMPAANSANMIIQLKQAGLPNDVSIITSNSGASKTFIDIGGKAVEGAIVVSEFSPPGATDMAKKFTEDYTKRYGTAPDNWAGLGYTSMQIVADAIKRAQPNVTRETLTAKMKETKDLPVVAGNGKLTIGADRFTLYELQLLTVKDGKFVPVT